MNEWGLIVAGLALLTAGSDFLIRGATAIARRFGVSELLIGLTLVGFGTSTPELVSSVQAAMVGSPGVAVGNVVGSNVANILLILGAAAIIAPVPIPEKSFIRDTLAVAAATAAAIAVSMTGGFSRSAGAAFLLALAAYIVLAYLTERRAPDAAETIRKTEEAAALPALRAPLVVDFLFVAAGLALLVFGAKLFVGGAIGIAQAFGVSETIIGLTLVAVGTSLPELATSLMASLRGRGALALGNVVGSNIYNILGILGATALVRPLAAPAEIIRYDNWVMAGATALMILFAHTQRRINRFEGAALLLAYAAFVVWLARRAAS